MIGYKIFIILQIVIKEARNGMEFDQPCVAEIFSFLFVPLEMDIMLIYTDEFFIATIYYSKHKTLYSSYKA